MVLTFKGIWILATGIAGPLRGGCIWPFLCCFAMVVLSLLGYGDAMIQSAVVPAVPRSQAQLEKGRVMQATGKARNHWFSLLSDWLHPPCLYPIGVAKALEEFGKLAFTSKWTRHNSAETLNAVQTRYHWLRKTPQLFVGNFHDMGVIVPAEDTPSYACYDDARTLGCLDGLGLAPEGDEPFARLLRSIEALRDSLTASARRHPADQQRSRHPCHCGDSLGKNSLSKRPAPVRHDRLPGQSAFPHYSASELDSRRVHLFRLCMEACLHPAPTTGDAVSCTVRTLR